MGNARSKRSVLNGDSVDGVYIQRQDLCQQNLSGSLSGRSSSLSSHVSNFSLSRPWSRVSRRRWKESTLTLPYEASKTAWPVSQNESVFLPEFPLLSEERRFENLGQVAKGAFGKVYKVQHEGRLYALKVLSKSKIIKEDAVRQVKDEVQIQRVCGHHPFIVACPYHWQSKKRVYIVSDFVSGGELYNLLKIYTVLPVALVQLYVAQLALALDFLHNAGVIYRDLKPENVLLDADGNVQLIDFGLSKWLSYGKTTRTICGTFHYMAPEILAYQDYGHGADWWSLGIIACLMLTGKYPTTEPDSEREDRKCVRLPESEIETASRDLLLRLLQTQPTQRLRSLRSLQTIAFYKGFNFDDVRNKVIRPNDLLPPPPSPPSITSQFSDFDENCVTTL